MDDALLFFALLAFIIVILGPIAFFLTLGARSRLRRAEREIVALREALRDVALRPAKPSAEAASAPITPASTTVSAPVEEPVPSDALEDVEAAPPSQTLDPEAPATPPPITPPVVSPPRGKSLEETLGTQWSVWVGGIALSLGAVFLVRYSFERGWFGPGARVLLGLIFAAALICAGDYLRRRDRATNVATPASSYVPAVLTAAGTIGAFAAIYAAHALYGFIGPALAFLALGAVGIAAMLAAALHGPALAGLGLIGSLIAPVLVDSNEPNPWPVVLYLTMVIAFAYGLARLHLWLWLALSAAAGGLIWCFAFLGGHSPDFIEAAWVHASIQMFMATGLFAVINGARVADQDAQMDRYALGVPSCFAAALLISLNAGIPFGLFGSGWVLTACIAIAILGIAGLRLAAAAGLVLAAGAALALSLLIWPAFGSMAAFPFAHWFPKPEAGKSFATSSGLAASLLALLSARRLLQGAALRSAAALIYAGGATLIPLATLTICYLRLAQSESSASFAAVAGGLAFAFVFAAQLFFTRDAALSQSHFRLGLGVFAAASFAALALGLVFWLDQGMLTIALALAALGAAFVDWRLGIDALRWCVAGLGVIVAARILYDPRIVGDDLGQTLIFNWLLWGYGVPAAAFGMAARLLRRRQQDTPVLVAQALSILFSALLVFFEIRHAIHAGDPFAEDTGLIEQGLLAVSGYGFSIVLTRLDAARTSLVFRSASLGFGALSFAQSLLGLLLIENPLWSGEPISGGLFINDLLPAYGLPAILAWALGHVSRHTRPSWYWLGARIAALVLGFTFANLELRHLFRGENLTWTTRYPQPAHYAEIYSYSALWLALSIICLAIGIWRGAAIARLASAILMLMAILKVFLYDLSGLEGVYRAMSFIGLGLVLIGIGLSYQHLVFKRQSGDEPQPDLDYKA